MTGVRPPARDEGRREGGHDDKGCPSVIEDVETTRLWPVTGRLSGVDSDNNVGISFIQIPNSRAVTGVEEIAERENEAEGGRQKTRVARKSATAEVMPVKRCMKKLGPY